jgi:hypothetical protein
MANATSHTFSFFRAGGFDQVRLETGADLVALEHLDQKLWFALACPTRGIEIDARTLELLDTQKDSRIRANELIGAAKFAGQIYKNVDDLIAGQDTLPLDALSDSDGGKRILTAAKAVLQSLGKPTATALSIADMAAATKAFDAQPFNGDGVVPPASAADDGTRAAAIDVLACMGPETDRGGLPGINQAKIDGFFKELEAHAAWLAKGDADAAIKPFGDGTAAAFAAVIAVKARVDDYFVRCKVAAFDSRAVTGLNREDKEWLAIGQKDFSASAAEVAQFPLARIEAGRALPLSGDVNPAWAAGLADLNAKVPSLADKAALTHAEWTALLARLDPFAGWQAAKAGAAVEKLGPARVKELLSGKAKEQLAGLMGMEKLQEPVATALLDVERAVRYRRDLYRLANNFVSFKDFYGRKGPAVFQAGTLYLDQRACELCIRVEDAGKHATMAPLSRAYLAYCDLSRPATGDKMTIAAAFTAGDSDDLMVGRNGVFYDRAGNDWDATITKIVDNPISIRQAFWSPYKKLLRFIEEQVNKRAAAADTASTTALTGAATKVEQAAETGKAEGAPPAPKKIDIGTVAALGVAVGGITAALGAMMDGLFGLGMWMPLGLLGLLLAISGPSMLIAWLKLRQRSLGPLLDANGWALNAPGRINVPFGASLTRTAELPPGSRREMSDPFAEKPRPWGLWIFLAVLLLGAGAWYLGKLDAYLPTSATSVSVLGANAPASHARPAAPAPAPAAEEKK